jgi:hypothetical protein
MPTAIPSTRAIRVGGPYFPGALRRKVRNDHELPRLESRIKLPNLDVVLS